MLREHPAITARPQIRPDSAGRSDPALRQLEAVIVLSGSVRGTRFCSSIGCSRVELPMAPGTTILEHWHRQCDGLAQSIGTDALPVRVVVDHGSDLPTRSRRHGSVSLSVEQDPTSYRGTAGLLKDLCSAYADDALILVVTGAQVLLSPLTDVVDRLALSGGDVSVLSHRDGTPSGLMLMRCGVLNQVAEIGFVDLKEKGLSLIARRHAVKVVECDDSVSMPIRTLPEYIHALRRFHTMTNGRVSADDPFAEQLESTFVLTDREARIGQSVRLYDSVVLGGATVGDDAIVVRSVIGRGAVVRPGQRIVDRLVASTSRGPGGRG